MIVALLVGGILMVVTLWMAPHVPVWMGAEKAIHADATRYFIFINLPMIFRAATIIFGSAIRATGDTKTPMIVNVWVNVINIGLNYVFIYLLGQGAVGAGKATPMASYTIGGLLMTVVFLRNPRLDVLGKGSAIVQGKGTQDDLSVTTRQVLMAVLAISLPVVMTRLASCLGHVVFTSFVSSMDTITYAAHAIAITAEEIFYIPGYGMMAATSTLIGHAIGEKNKQKEKDVKIVSIALIFGLMCITGILLFVGAHGMMCIFTKDPAGDRHRYTLAADGSLYGTGLWHLGSHGRYLQWYGTHPLSPGGGTHQYVGRARGRHLSLRACLRTGNHGGLDYDDLQQYLKSCPACLRLACHGTKKCTKIDFRVYFANISPI